MPIALILQLAMIVFTNLPALITSAEVAFGHKSGTGAQKKAVVIETVKTGLTIANTINKGKPVLDENTTAVIVGAAGALTDGVVGILNAAGVLKPPEPVQAG